MRVMAAYLEGAGLQVGTIGIFLMGAFKYFAKVRNNDEIFTIFALTITILYE